jgi:hypothetical protein
MWRSGISLGRITCLKDVRAAKGAENKRVSVPVLKDLVIVLLTVVEAVVKCSTHGNQPVGVNAR